ncbi:hypothetical protein [Treponema pectinovorum]|uniref:hypothetical protein n=1 Tax=Treponema pectinovorum TaxID=164 RepID=UPI0011CB7E52|nr:hypothetical protein [Treponema pectinovorum]
MAKQPTSRVQRTTKRPYCAIQYNTIKFYFGRLFAALALCKNRALRPSLSAHRPRRYAPAVDGYAATPSPAAFVAHEGAPASNVDSHAHLLVKFSLQ